MDTKHRLATLTLAEPAPRPVIFRRLDCDPPRVRLHYCRYAGFTCIGPTWGGVGSRPREICWPITARRHRHFCMRYQPPARLQYSRVGNAKDWLRDHFRNGHELRNIPRTTSTWSPLS